VFERVKEIVGGIERGFKQKLGGRENSTNGNSSSSADDLNDVTLDSQGGNGGGSGSTNYGAIESNLFSEEGGTRGLSLLNNDYLSDEGVRRMSSAIRNASREEEDLIQPGGRDKHKSCFRRFVNKLGENGRGTRQRTKAASCLVLPYIR